MPLLESWARWEEPASLPFALDCDLDALRAGGSQKHIAAYGCWRDARDDPGFCSGADTRLHLGLLPHPFCGNLRTATIFVLLLNPGLGAHDYYDEYEVPGCRSTVLRNLKQEFSDDSPPFFLLDPQYAWYGGFAWWHAKLAGVIETLAREWDTSFAEARLQLAMRLASIQLLPYHSLTSAGAGRWLNKLNSVQLARTFVAEEVLPRVERGEAIVIVTRKVDVWKLPDHPGIVKYSRGQSRGASLSPRSPGGMEILKHLLHTEPQ